jgi:hypothetical protein
MMGGTNLQSACFLESDECKLRRSGNGDPTFWSLIMVRPAALAAFVSTTLVAGLVFAQLAFAQQGLQTGKIAKIDAEKGELTIRSSDGKEHDVIVAKDTQIRGAGGSPVKDRLKAPEFKVDAAVMFKVGKVEGKRGVLDGLKLLGPDGANKPGGAPPEKVDTAALKPLT